MNQNLLRFGLLFCISGSERELQRLLLWFFLVGLIYFQSGVVKFHIKLNWWVRIIK